MKITTTPPVWLNRCVEDARETVNVADYTTYWLNKTNSESGELETQRERTSNCVDSLGRLIDLLVARKLLSGPDVLQILNSYDTDATINEAES